MSAKANVYGPGGSYNIFAGKDGSRGLGLSSLKAEDAVADYSVLDEKSLQVLDDWHAFFSYVHLVSFMSGAECMILTRKRYNIVGRVVDDAPVQDTSSSSL